MIDAIGVLEMDCVVGYHCLDPNLMQSNTSTEIRATQGLAGLSLFGASSDCGSLF